MTVVETTVVFALNGQAVSVRAGHPHLLAALREELDITSPKDGCSPSGQCGCCTVMLDGKAQVACQIPLAKAAGRSVTTLEGVDEAERQRYASAFAACGGLQCGFCIPGIVMRAKAQVDRKGAALTREDMARHLGAHLCRCTGYVKILDAIETVAGGRELVPLRPGGIGSRGAKYEAELLALGDRGYVDDLRVPGMLHAALRLTDHARADVTRIVTSGALAAPGVVGVFTAADVPGDLRVGIIHQDWPVLIPQGGRTSYAGDVIAIVVAGTRQEARAAAELVEVSYEPLAPLTDPVAAAASHEIAVWGTDDNVLSRSAYARGDVDAALAASAHVVHDVFETQRVEHAFLEPESTLAVPRPDGGLHVYSGGQGVWDDRNQIAAVLGLERDQVSVELVSNGGAFGGKEDMSNQAQAALAAWLLRRPVKCTLSREESFLMHPKRHPITLEYWAGCDQEGRLTAVRACMMGDSGAYASVGMKVLERAAGHATGPYRVPSVDVESVAVRTNNPICGAFRGFGANQAQFAMEGVMDRLAEKVGVTGWEIRKRNVVHPGDIWGPGQVMDDGCAGAERCLDVLASRYEEARAAGKAVGLGLGLKNSGLGNGFKEVTKAVVRFRADGRVEVRHGWTEMGQGVHTVALQVAVEELGIDPARVVVLVDTSRELGQGQTTGSRATLMGAGAVREACRAAKEAGCQLEVDYVGEHRVDWTHHLGEVDHPVIHSAFGYAAQLVIADPQSGAIERVVAAHDVGRAVNPTLCEGQVEGSVHMGLGYALTEEFPSDDGGFPTKTTLRSLGILRPKDVPPIEVVLVEVPQPRSPYGIKGVGEIGLVPTAGAVAAALHAADGRWRTTLPMRPPKAADAAAGDAAAGDAAADDAAAGDAAAGDAERGRTVPVALYLQDAHTIRAGMEYAAYAEARGFDAVWQAESRLVRESTVPLAAFAAVTGRIRVGSGVADCWSRNPARLAATFSTLDDLAPGRVLLGLGAWWDPLARKVGVNRARPLTVMREVVTAVRALLHNETVSFDGYYVHFDGVELDYVYQERRPKEVPIYIGATGDQMLELAGEIADGVLLNYLVSPDYNDRAMERLQAGLDRSGRALDGFDRPQLVVCSVHEDEAVALDMARLMVTQYLGQQPHIMAASGVPRSLLDAVGEVLTWPATHEQVETASKLVPDDTVRMLTACGTPAQARARVADYLSHGATCPVLYPLGDVRATIDAFAGWSP